MTRWLNAESCLVWVSAASVAGGTASATPSRPRSTVPLTRCNDAAAGRAATGAAASSARSSGSSCGRAAAAVERISSS